MGKVLDRFNRLQAFNKRHKRAIRRTILLVILLLGVIGFLISYNYVLAWDKNEDVKIDLSVNPEEAVKVEIPMGSTTTEIAKVLKDSGVIRYPSIFKLLSKINGFDNGYQAGTHRVGKDMDYDKLMRILSEKPESITITIPEGYSFRQIKEALAKKNIVNPTQWSSTAETGNFDYDFLKDLGKRNHRLEGYLFPDTYEFALNVADREVINTMLSQFNKKFKPEYKVQAKSLGMTTDEVITLASIVEREAKLSEERKKIAGVFYNRLKGMNGASKKLESCATVQYVFLNRDGIIKEKISIEDTKVEDPYNTYVNEGLPPGPICSPGEAAIIAALNPESHNYLYFVAKPDRTHYFSETLAEHNSAVERYSSN